MAEYEYEYEEAAIHDGFEDQMAKTNKTEVGTTENLNAWKAMAIRHGQELQEIELGAKLEDMAERRAIERERLEIEREKAEAEREKAEAEAIAREKQAKAESKRFGIQCGLSGLALLGSIVFAFIGWETDKPDSERIRNGSREKDRNKIFEFGEKLSNKLGR